MPDDTKDDEKLKGPIKGEDLREIVPISQELRSLVNTAGDDPLGWDEAQKVIFGRLPRPVSMQLVDDTVMEGIAWTLAGYLPPEMRTRRILESMDLRPLLTALAENPDAKIHAAFRWGPDSYKENPAGLYVHLSEAITEQIRADATAVITGQNMTPEDEAAYLERQVAFDATTVKPLAQFEGIDEAAGTDPNAPVDPNAILLGDSTGATGRAAFPEAEIRDLMNTNQLTLEGLMEWENSVDNTTGRRFPVLMEDKPPNPYGSRQGSPSAHATDRPSAKVLSPMEALLYPQQQSPEAVRRLQINLANAGYFDQIEGGNMVDWGDPFDPATMAAWKLALTDQMKRGDVSLTKLLVDRSKTYRENMRTERLKALPELNRDYVRLDADTLAESYLGRRLTGSEFTNLMDYLNGLRTERAGYVASAEDNPRAGFLVGETGVNDADVETFFNNTSGDEQRSNDWGSMLYKLEKTYG